MNSFAVIALIGWVPLTLLFFVLLQPRRALIFSYLGSWTLLPPLSISIPGLPDFSKITAATLGSLLGLLLFGLPYLSRFRFRWYDLPAVVIGVCPFISSLTNDLGPYDGFSAALTSILTWSFPYFLGRILLSEAEGVRDLALGLTIAGLVCTPLIVFEVATGRSLDNAIYGTRFALGVKYGLSNPFLFMPQALILAIFMATTAVAAAGIQWTGAVQSVLGIPSRICVPILIAANLVGHQTGGILLMVVGLVTLHILVTGQIHPLIQLGAVAMVPVLAVKNGLRVALMFTIGLFAAEHFRRTNPNRLVWALVLVIPFYTGLRATGLWSGDVAVSLAYQFFGAERAVSIGYRFGAEDQLVAKALQRPFFGWGGWGRARLYNEFGRNRVATDGLWVIILGQNGLVGLGAMVGIFLLPLARFLKHYPTHLWSNPTVTPMVAIGIILELYAIDNLLNASVNPVVTLIAGGLAGLAPALATLSHSRISRELEWVDRFIAEGHLEQAEEICHRLIVSQDPATAAEGWGRLADLRGSQRQWDQASEAARQALELRSQLVRCNPGVREYLSGAADDMERLARCLTRQDQFSEAIATWEEVIHLRGQLAMEAPDSTANLAWARSLNDLAWLTAGGSSAPCSDPERAIALAEKAVTLDPANPTHWNTLGLAYFRGGRWDDSISALSRSTTLGQDDYRGVNDLIMAMAWKCKGQDQEAMRLLHNSQVWFNSRHKLASSLEHLRTELTQSAITSASQS